MHVFPGPQNSTSALAHSLTSAQVPPSLAAQQLSGSVLSCTAQKPGLPTLALHSVGHPSGAHELQSGAAITTSFAVPPAASAMVPEFDLSSASGATVIAYIKSASISSRDLGFSVLVQVQHSSGSLLVGLVHVPVDPYATEQALWHPSGAQQLQPSHSRCAPNGVHLGSRPSARPCSS